MNAARRRTAVILTFVVAAVTLAGCDAGRVGGRCRPNGKWGHDATYVLRCVNGRWANTGLTMGDAARILLTPPAPPTTTAPPVTVPVVPPARKQHVTTWDGVVAYPDTLPDPARWQGTTPLYFADNNPLCNIAGIASPSAAWDRIDASTIELAIQLPWASNEGTIGGILFGCSTKSSITIDIADAGSNVTATAVSIPLVNDTVTDLPYTG